MKKETFVFEGNDAATVALVGNFTGWEQSPIPLKRQKNGSWKVVVPLNSGTHEYRFVVDGQWCDDRQCQTRATNPYGGENCVRHVAP